jgi:Lrp/AsnC family transcriptional regulator, leucine-responsive regulatory protein
MLDNLDKKILCILDHEARISYSNIARHVKRGRDTVEYRIDRLEREGIILGYRAIIDPYSFGLTLFKSYLRLANNGSRLNRLMKSLQKHPSVFWTARCDGPWDVIVSIAAPSVYEFHTIQGEILSDISDILIASQVYAVVSFQLFKKKYLYKVGTHWFKIGGEPRQVDLDEGERALLLLLGEEGRVSVAEAARRLDLTPAMVTTRMQRLEEEKIIRGYKTEMNLARLGITQFKAQLQLSRFDRSAEQELELYCARHPNIACFIHQIGECRMEIEVHSYNLSDYHRVINELREKFSSLIKSVSMLLMHQDNFQWMVGVRVT